MKKNFLNLLRAKWQQGKFVCVGLDPDWGKIPNHLKAGKKEGDKDVIVKFCTSIIDATKDLVCAYKPNSAFFEAFGAPGIEALKEIIEHIALVTSDVPVILDFKRADIGNTNNGYVTFAFDYCGANAVTVHPYLGHEAMKPFLDRKDDGIIVLCKTSNDGSDEIQNLPVTMDHDTSTTKLVYEIVAEKVADYWNYNRNCLLVVGATYPEELKKVRSIVGGMPILIPGIGAQGGDLEQTLAAGFTERGSGVIINSSRGIIYASSGEDFAECAFKETYKLHNAIDSYRFIHYDV